MSELFQPITAEQLFAWIFSELDAHDSVFGIPRQHFFPPLEDDLFRSSAYGHLLETPFGPAAGPHSQMAQNIVAAWLYGARYIELKTVQTLDALDVPKPCIDMEDEGYNVEWSQELKIDQSFDEYLRAWVLIHALHHKLGFPGDTPGMVFNLSVGYNLEGIQQPNMQWFLNQMHDCSEDILLHECRSERIPELEPVDPGPIRAVGIHSVAAKHDLVAPHVPIGQAVHEPRSHRLEQWTIRWRKRWILKRWLWNALAIPWAECGVDIDRGESVVVV